MTTYYASYPVLGGGGGAVPTYSTLSAFPSAVTAGNGALAIALDTDTLYISNGTTWQVIASPSGSGHAITALTGDVVATGPGSVTATIQAGVVTGSKIASATITGSNIAATTITNGLIANGTIDLTAKVTNVLPIANGGTNSSTTLNNNRVMVSSGGAIIETSAITANAALISNASGIPIASSTTSTELGYVHGVTSAIQTQINGLANTALSNLTVSGLTADDLLYATSSSAVGRLAIGSNGQVLGVVSGAPAWIPPPSIVSAFTTNWITSDGTTKTVTHSLGTLDVIVQLYDEADGTTINVDSVARTNTNTVTLISSQAPDSSGWRVLILAI